MSTRLVGGGLAIVAGQSCIAGPSVCFTSRYSCLLYGFHLPFPSGGTKKCSRRHLERERLGGCLAGRRRIHAARQEYCSRVLWLRPRSCQANELVYHTQAACGEQVFLCV